MKIHRFIGGFDFSADSLEIMGDLAHQMQGVLRLRVGENIVLGDGAVGEVLAKIAEITKQKVTVLIRERLQNANESERDVRLYCSILKHENFELVVQKATEVGVNEIVPIIAARTVKLRLNHKRLQKIIHEAAEQSGRGIVPVLHEAIMFKEAIDATKNDAMNIFFDASGETLHTPQIGTKKISLFIGPEGGWMPNELEMARKAAFSIASLGKLILRAETAAIVAIYSMNK